MSRACRRRKETTCPLCNGKGVVKRKGDETRKEEWLSVYWLLHKRLGRPPSIRTLAKARGRSKTAAAYFIRRWIADEGREPRVKRGKGVAR
jgi:hypothetical protein